MYSPEPRRVRRRPSALPLSPLLSPAPPSLQLGQLKNATFESQWMVTPSHVEVEGPEAEALGPCTEQTALP